MLTPILEVKNLSARAGDKEIIKNFSLTINEGEIHALMGPNGAGKSTLAHVLAGKPNYEITSGSIKFLGRDLQQMKPEERATAGLFLSMQYPVAIPGVSTANFLKHAVNAKRKYNQQKELDAAEFLKLLRTESAALNIPAEMLKREINVGFSGGEKKRLEILQMRLLRPALAILDEADSGLDIDALRIVAEGINRLHNEHNALLIITHHLDLLNQITPDFVHIYYNGHIVRTGDNKLAEELEENGYKNFVENE